MALARSTTARPQKPMKLSRLSFRAGQSRETDQTPTVVRHPDRRMDVTVCSALAEAGFLKEEDE